MECSSRSSRPTSCVVLMLSISRRNGFRGAATAFVDGFDVGAGGVEVAGQLRGRACRLIGLCGDLIEDDAELILVCLACLPAAAPAIHGGGGWGSGRAMCRLKTHRSHCRARPCDRGPEISMLLRAGCWAYAEPASVIASNNLHPLRIIPSPCCGMSTIRQEGVVGSGIVER